MTAQSSPPATDPDPQFSRWCSSSKECAGSISAVERINAALLLHQKTTMQALAVGCYDGWTPADCEHEDECPLVDVQVCRECYGFAEEIDEERALRESSEWPCATARALGVAE